MTNRFGSILALFGFLLLPLSVAAVPAASQPVEFVPQYLYSAVYSAFAWSPDGSHIAAASYDGYVRIIEVRSGIVERAWPVGSLSALFLAFSPDASRLFLMTETATAGVMLAQVDVSTGNVSPRQEFPGPARAALSADGKVLAIGRRAAHQVVFFETDSMTALAPLPVPGGADFGTMALSTDGRFVALGLPDGKVMLLERLAGAVQPDAGAVPTPPMFSCGEGPVTAMTFSPDSSRLACGTEKAEVLSLLTVPSLTREKDVAEPEAGIQWAAFLPGGNSLLVASGQGLREVTVADGSEVRRLKSSDGEVLSVFAAAVSPDGKGIAVSAGFNLILFDGPEKEGRVVGPCMADNYRVSISADASLALFTQTIASASVSIDLKEGARAALISHSDFAPDFWSVQDARGQTAAVKTNIEGFRIVDPRTGKVLHSIDLEIQSGSHLITLSPDGAMALVNRYASGQILLDARTGKWGRTVESSCSGMPASFSKNGKVLYIATDGLYANEICVVDVGSGKEVGTLRDEAQEGTVFDFALSPSGKQLVAVYAQSKKILLWDTKKRLVRHRLELPEEAMLANFSPDEKLAAIVSVSGKLYVWDIESGKPPRVLQVALPGAALAAVFTPNGKRIFLAETYGSVHLVDLESGRTLTTTVVLGTGDWLTYTPEGFFEGSDGAIALFRVRTPEGLVPLKDRTQDWRKGDKLKEVLGGR